MSAPDAPRMARTFAAAAAWIDEAVAGGLIESRLRDALRRIETRSADDLFAQPGVRPMVVGLFGGTGVGKSSLLNRIVRRDVARVGVRRPTSETLTLYVHRDVELSSVPAPALAETDFRVERHADAALAGLALIDAPDFDSTRASNRQCSLAWLPFIDLVVYVVSPERYRDDVGWRLLLERRGWHGWVFLLNRADEGDPQQAQDLERLLRGAGFEAPLLLQTCGSESFAAQRGGDDAFDVFRQQLDRLVGQHALAELRRVGLAARGEAVCAVLTQARAELGDEAAWQTVQEELCADWRRVQERLLDGLSWQFQSVAQRIAARQAAPSTLAGVARLMRGAPANAGQAPPGHAVDEPEPDELDYLTQTLGDDATLQRLRDFVDRAELAARAAHVPAAAIRARLNTLCDGAIAELRRGTRAALQAALSAPQRDWRSRLARLFAAAALALPIAALAYAAWHVTLSYSSAVAGTTRFLTGDFLMHSGMLVALAWAIPFAASRALRPSAAQRALHAIGIAGRTALGQLGESFVRAMGDVRRSAARESQRCAAMVDELTSMLQWGERSRPEVVRRLLSHAASER